MSGADVRQLNRDLVAVGYASSADVAAAGWDYFSWATTYALERLQAHLGLTQAGTLPLGQAVVLPSALRVTALPAGLGAPAAGTVLAARSAPRGGPNGPGAAQQHPADDCGPVTITL